MTIDPTGLRSRMLGVLRESGVLRGDSIEGAFMTVPRELFLPGVPLERVYSGDAIPTKRDLSGNPISSSSEVGVMVVMIEMLQLAPGHRVLEIGAGTGYNAAVLSVLVGGTGEVTTVEIDPRFAEEARGHLSAAGFGGPLVVTGDGWLGHPERAPYDRIEVTASSANVSPRWVDQLTPEGRVVLPLRLPAGPQILVAFRKDDGRLLSTSVRPGGFMPLRGTNAPAPTFTAIGNFEVEPAELLADAIDVLAALLSERPRVEVGPPMRWDTYSLLALEPGALSVRRRGQQGSAVGIFDRRARGLALVEMAGGPLSGPLSHIVSFGAPSVTVELKERLEVLASAVLGDLSISAEPCGGPDAPGYRFAFARRVATE